jgi:hypothetical protein
MNFEVPLGSCPKCAEEELDIYAVRAKNGVTITCSRGHAFDNDLDYSRGITKSERKKMKKADKKAMDNIMGAMENPEKSETPAIQTVDPSDFVIDEVDKARIEALLGEFSDSSTLVGKIFALDQEKKELASTIRNARKIKVEAEDGKILESGDLKIEGIIPERHVQPLLDLSHSWNQSVTRWVNERLSSLMDDMLFY